MPFLPMSRKEMASRGWDACDVVLVTGDAYVDHPSFGAAAIARWLERHGYRVGVVAQPDWRSAEDFKRLGRPRLFFGVSAGNIDSMLHHYTANRKLRRDDPYSPGGRHGLRPNRASIVYCNRLREAFPGTPLVLGGIEASLRRLAHYDYWDDAVRRSLLVDAKADLLVHGMGERQVLEIARRAEAGESVAGMSDILGTAAVLGRGEMEELAGSGRQFDELPTFHEISSSMESFNLATRMITAQIRPSSGKALVQRHGDRWVLANPPAQPLSTAEMDEVYGLPYERQAHPLYREPVPALETVRWSVVSHRGCYGGCSFCTLFFHQGPVVQSRSIGSIVREAKVLASDHKFKGTITDIGGPTANMYGTGCGSPSAASGCRRRSCLAPSACPRLNADQSPSLRLWRAVARVPGVKRVLVASGVRHDLALQDRKYLAELVRKRTGGHLKVAPEHCSPRVLKLMNKPPIGLFAEFLEAFRRLSPREQYLVPYLISSHPGCAQDDMRELARFLVRHRLRVEQVQDFIPLPMTVSAAMYRTGAEPFTGEEVFVERTAAGKLRQRYSLGSSGAERWEIGD
jgi:uncharacterized radical SAM protein YgiQ